MTPTAERVTEERLQYLAVMHFNIDFLPSFDEFRDMQLALRELQSARADAARYRYWRECGCGAEAHVTGVILHTYLPVKNLSFRAEGIDTAVDTAMQERKP